MFVGSFIVSTVLTVLSALGHVKDASEALLLLTNMSVIYLGRRNFSMNLGNNKSVNFQEKEGSSET
jgi:hypothetical protein